MIEQRTSGVWICLVTKECFYLLFSRLNNEIGEREKKIDG